MGGSSILKLYDDGHHSDWTITLNYSKSFQYIIGIIELFISYLTIYELLYEPLIEDTYDIDITLLNIFLGFALIGWNLYTFLLRANLDNLTERISNCIRALFMFIILCAWIYFDNLIIPIYILSGMIIGFLSGFIVPYAPSDRTKKKYK